MLLQPASQHLSQASHAPDHGVFPRAKFPQPLSHLIATAAAPLGELEVLLPHHETLVKALTKLVGDDFGLPLAEVTLWEGSKAQNPGIAQSLLR